MSHSLLPHSVSRPSPLGTRSLALACALTGALTGALSACTTDTGGGDNPATGTGSTTTTTGSTTTDPLHLELDPNCSPFAMADDCLTPWPNLTTMAEDADSETGLRLNYSIDMFSSPDGDLPIDPAIFNGFDGVSPISPVLINLGRDVDPDLLHGHGDEEASVATDSAIALVRVTDGSRVPILVELDQSNRDLSYDGRWVLIIRPVAPLELGERYVVALTQDVVDTDGASFDSPAAFVALRDAEITDDDRVEGMRQRYTDDLFPALQTAGIGQQDLLVAWEYQVASRKQVLGPITGMRDEALASIADSGVDYTVDEVVTAPNDMVDLVVLGTFSPPNFLNDQELVYSDDNYSTIQQKDRPSYEYTMVVPAGLPRDQPVPLVVIGHGIFGSGRDYIYSGGLGSLFQEMAQEAGVVLVATDWIGLSSGDFDLIVSEVVPDISRIRIVTDRLAQSLINNMTLIELTRNQLQYVDGTGHTADAPLIDPDALYYYGVSLGGIQGTSLTGLDEEISRSAVAVPGAGWVNMIQRSVDFEEIDTLLDLLYPDPLTQLVFINALQSWFDASDPVNLGRLIPERGTQTMVVQEAIGDCQVPNLATEILARTVHASHLEAATNPIYGIDTIDGPVSNDVALTQILLSDSVAEYMPPDENTVPTQDNGVHSDAITTDVALSQVLTAVQTGTIVNPCDGACDPD